MDSGTLGRAQMVYVRECNERERERRKMGRIDE
jgi:hypothetical protein